MVGDAVGRGLEWTFRDTFLQRGGMTLRIGGELLIRST